ncbi:MAG: PorP/SprF family type IX secretion system membrane protein [Bacteroidales bacterium]|nr:PorP/SprF family type IX secretion system membrane protein [Bacteroidales bacterium]
MRLNRTNFLLIPLLFTTLSGFGQDPNFSQFLGSRIYYNPAFVGSVEGMEINLDIRKCWTSVPASPQSYLLSLDKSFWNIKGLGGVGLFTLKNIEGAGGLSTLIFGLPVSSRVRLTEKITLKMALMPQYHAKSIHWDRLVFSDQLDPQLGKVLQQSPGFQYGTANLFSFFDLGYGFIFTYQSHPEKQNKLLNSVINAGFSLNHLPEPEMSFLGMPYLMASKIVVHVDGYFPLKRSFLRNEMSYLMPQFEFEKQGSLQSYIVGLSVKRNPIIVGAFVRNKNLNPKNTTDLILLFGYQFNLNDKQSSRITVNYSYDVTFSKLNNHDSGSHELGVTINLDNFYIFHDCENCKDDKWILGN